MTRILEALRQFFGREEPVGPVLDHLLHGSLNSADRNELFYAQLLNDKRDDNCRDCPWPTKLARLDGPCA